MLIEALKDNEFFVTNFVSEQLVAYLVAKMFSEDSKGKESKEKEKEKEVGTQFIQKKYL